MKVSTESHPFAGIHLIYVSIHASQNGRLLYTPNLQHVLRILTELYHHCLSLAWTGTKEKSLRR